MNQFFDITDRELLRKLLMSLHPQTIPTWGKMKPQQMVEHLADQVCWTNGKKIATCRRSPDEAETVKQRMIYTDAELPTGIVSGEVPENYAYNNIEEATDAVLSELDEFDTYFVHPGTTAVHAGFGPMNYNEWQIWHGKHFTHHLKQFGLI